MPMTAPLDPEGFAQRQLHLRQATAADVPRINKVAVLSKAFWGYSPEQLALWRDDLVVDPKTAIEWPTVVAESDGQISGFAQLDPTRNPWDLARLFVEPGAHRQGVGRSLLTWIQGLAAEAGQAEISIDSDPHAAAFYIACGATVQGIVAAPLPGEPHRTRPQLLLRTKVA